MHRTTIMLPSDLKSKALRRAKSRGMSLGQLIRRSLEEELKQPAGLQEDPFLDDKEVFTGRAPGDASVRHDEYLYGDRE